MGFDDLDPFDDIFANGATKNVRAGAKFQPKSKFQPRKASSASVPSSQSVQTVGITDNDFTETLRTDEPLKNKEDAFSRIQLSDERISSELINLSVEHVVSRQNVDPDNSGDWFSSLEKSKSAGENADIFIGLESLDDFLTQDSQHGTFHVTDMRSPEEGLDVPVLSPVNNSTAVSNTAHCHMSSELTSMQDPLSCMETAVSNSNGDIHVDNRSETREADVFSSQNLVDVLSDLTTTSGRRFGKFQPKPKIQNHKEKHTASFSNPDAVESISCPQDTESVPYEYDHMDEGSIPAFSDSFPTELTSELPVNRDPTNPMENSQSDAAIPGEVADPDMPEKVASQRAKSRRRKIPTVSDRSSEHQNASILGQQDETRRSSRPRRNQKKACQLVDEFEDEGLGDRDNPAEQCPNGSVTNQDDNNDEEYHMESDSEIKKMRIKSKKPVAEKEKTVRKRKGGDEASNESTKKPSKKFPHSTRRNRRQVDKVLLETPEHEIDFQKLRIRDLILFAEYKERTNKTATTSETPSMNQSAGASFTHNDEDEAFGSEHGRFSNDEHERPTVQESSTYFNYQTFMNKTPSTRWSKQDTELFYEAVQQFGTDLSMIQQLFPARTRRQILLKYKKEQRQHPLRLGEALTNRSKDHSHFEQVIERLKQIAAEEKQKYNEEDSIGLTGEEEAVEATQETNEEVAKPEQTEEGAEDIEEPNGHEVHSPVKSDDEEDDFYRWSQYKSEL